MNMTVNELIKFLKTKIKTGELKSNGEISMVIQEDEYGFLTGPFSIGINKERKELFFCSQEFGQQLKGY